MGFFSSLFPSDEEIQEQVQLRHDSWIDLDEESLQRKFQFGAKDSKYAMLAAARLLEEKYKWTYKDLAGYLDFFEDKGIISSEQNIKMRDALVKFT